MAGTFMVEIDTNNKAFDGGDDELTRILDTLIEKIKVRGTEGESFALMDINGNRVGTAWTEERSSAEDEDYDAHTVKQEAYREHITLRHEYLNDEYQRTQVYWAGGARIGIRKTQKGARKLADTFIEKARAKGQL